MRKVEYIYNLDSQTLYPAQNFHDDDLYFCCEVKTIPIHIIVKQLKWTDSFSSAKRLVDSGAIETNNLKLKNIVVNQLENNYIELKYKKMFKAATIQFVQNKHTKFNYYMWKIKNKIIALLENLGIVL
jgi:non-homologous end joining protein Ku